MLKVQAKNLGNVAVLSLQGQIVYCETAVLRNAIQSLSGISAIKLDLARVAMIDAGGLGSLLEFREHAESRSIRFELINVNKRVARILQITRLDTVFNITPSFRHSPVAAPRRVTVPALACA